MPIYNNVLYHSGNENSGRYPRGSGERPYQHVGGKVRKLSLQEQNELMGRINNVVNSTDNTIKNIDNRRSSRKQKNAKADLYAKAKMMSEDELKNVTSRLVAENNYVNALLQQTPNKSNTKQKVFDLLDDIKDVTVTAGALLGLMLTINKIKNA